MTASKTCAIFDLDGTLIRVSSEQVFLSYLLSHGEIPIPNLLAWIANFLKVKSLPVAKSNKVYLRGLAEQHLHEIARRCFVDTLRPSIAPHIAELIDAHRAEGQTVILMSGSLSFLVQPFHEHFQTDLMVAHKLEVVDGKFTGQRVGLHPFAENKAKLAEQLAADHGFDLSRSYAYGNHHTDVHKLRLFGHPVAVNPDHVLRRIAMGKRVADRSVARSVYRTMRLEKYIATSGIASRRAVKKHIQKGLVTVNGEPILAPGHRINVERDSVEFEGKQVKPLKERIYLMLNKPAGYLTTRRDERNRPTVMQLVADLSESIYPVGRLDLETEGLLLFTNDGDFAYRLLHPSHKIEKIYLAWVRGAPDAAAVQRMREGITIPSGRTAPATVKHLKASRDGAATQFEVIIHEGKKRQVRLMFKAVGHPVIRLKRVGIGNLQLGNLARGERRFLTDQEVAALIGL